MVIFKLLLVDDEYLELELLRDNVDWPALGFEICGTAKNGKEAAEIFADLHPDAVITDIKMPVMDGVELSHLLYSEYPLTSIVFLSGYNQFEYLKNALRVDAVDYLVKPLDLSEVPSVMSKVYQKCMEKRRVTAEGRLTAEHQLGDLLRADKPDITLFEAELTKLFGAPAAGEATYYIKMICTDEYEYLSECGEPGMRCIQDIGEAALAIAQKCPAIISELEDGRFVLISPKPLPNPAASDTSSKWMTVVSAANPFSLGQIPGAYKQLADKYSKALAFAGSGQVLSLPECNIPCPAKHFTKRPEFNSLIGYIQKGDREKADNWVCEYYDYAVQLDSDACHRYTVELIDVLYSGFLLPSSSLSQQFSSKTAMLKRLLKLRSPAVLKAVTGQFVQDVADGAARLNCDPTKQIISSVCDYIHQHYGEQLTIDSVAHHFNFSANYLSAVFKKTVGKTVLEYITDTRLQNAMSLLQETSLRIVQISQKIGYGNPSYFCSLFSKKYGVTPNQFRSRFAK